MVRFITLTLVYDQLNEKGEQRQQKELQDFVREKLKEQGKVPADEDEPLDPIEEALRESQRLYSGDKRGEEKTVTVSVNIDDFVFQPEVGEMDKMESNYAINIKEIIDMQEDGESTYLELLSTNPVTVKESIMEILDKIKLAQQ